MITVKTYPSSAQLIGEVYSMFFGMFPDMDPHEFATAYVNHVADTGHQPEVYGAMELFSTTGKVCG